MLAIADLSFSFFPSSQVPSFSINRCNSLRFREKSSPLAASKGSGNGSEDIPEESRGEKDVDWDKAWSSYKKRKNKKSFLSMFDVEQYVSRSPRNNGYPPSKETDPLKRTERFTLDFWTDSRFTLAGFGVIFTLLIYMVIIIGAPPPK